MSVNREFLDGGTSFTVSPSDVSVFSHQVLEALGDPFTYNPFRNPFTVFGFLWGLPIPIFSLGIQASGTSSSLWVLALNHPLQWFFMLHPFFFGCFFGVVGSLYVDHHRSLKYKATHDDLTGLLTHSVFHDTAQELVEEHRERDGSMGVIMLDLDNFKDVNDSRGHQAGDRVLKTVAEILREQTRDEDVIGRYGGEEFAAALPFTSPNESCAVAERVRREVASCSRRVPNDLTLSAGIGSYPENGPQLDDVIGEADRCLYRAKEEGRNRTIHSHHSGGNSPS